ncbi:UNVERIFIED_CONTAM: ds [Trichonephila clavipes]
MISGGLSTTAVVKVQVLDVNDNRPVFYPLEYNVSLPEGEIVSSAVVVIVATDDDSGIFGEISYEIIAGNDLGLFQIDHRTGEIFVLRSLSTEHPLHHLIISVKDGGGLVATAKAHVYISVISSDQQPPVFQKARYTFFVQEDAAPQSVVGTVVATSRDPRAGPVRYIIYSGDPEGFFTIDPLSGTIKTKGRLDHETHPFLLLNIQATNGRPPIYGHTQVFYYFLYISYLCSHSDMNLSTYHSYERERITQFLLQVNVTIWDVNDNAPRFASNSLKISVPENADLRTPIYVVHAEDPDSNRNGEVQYILLDNPDNMFIVGEKSGSIMLQHLLDYELRRHYILILSAIDSGSPPLSSNVTLMVEVQDVNDNAPTFEKSEYKVNVMESLSVNAQFLQVTATDMDTGNNARLTYKLNANVEDATSKFGIFPNSGFLYLKEVLDREAIDIYSLTVSASDNGSPSLSSTTIVQVQVLDANDNDPEFIEETFVFSVQENIEQGQHVGTISASDRDLGNNASLRYSLLNSNGSFQINPVTGEIFTKMSLDRESRPKYELTAEVRDQGTPYRSDQAVVNIQILDRNDNSPVFVEPVESVVEVLEEQPLGTEVVQVVAEDADQDENGSVVYEIIPGKENTDGAEVFSIDTNSGIIRTRRLLDHEDQKLYTLTVLAHDKGTPPRQSELKLQIQVLDLNDNQPVFPSSSLSFKIKEGVGVGQEVGVIQAVDEDGGENGRVMYSIVGGNLYDIFDIVRSTGSLYTIAEVDYEKASEYHLQIKAVDNSAVNPHSSVISVKIEVEDINDCAPVFKNDPILFSIPESTPQGTLVWNFSATDLDSGINGQVTYFVAQQSPASVFQIDRKSGALTLTETLDYEEFQEYTIVVTASDQARDVKQRLATSVTCKIIVEDKNDNAPIFKSKSKINVLESEPVNYPVLHVIALDKDSRDNGRVTYVISQGNERGHFSLDYDTGLLSVAKMLDREEVHHYELNITASDHGRPPKSTYQILHIYIEDVNDNPPNFKQHLYQANVSEAAPKGTFVLKVDATDIDLGENGKLSFTIPNGVAENKFTINSQTGEIHTASLLDREHQASYFITVYVRDGAFPSKHDTTTVKIDLLDVNDHAPEFGDSCYTLRVPENSDLSVIHTLVATDKDTNANAEVTYTITDGNTGNKFSIDLHTGQLSSRPLDREQVKQYRLVVSAHDQGEPPLAGMCNITVIVLDQNDNDPQFDHNEYSATIAEDAAINTTVIIVKAQDVDDGVNSEITYSLSNETKSLFRIDSSTGTITTAGLFDREKKSSYVFEVRATDGGRYDARSEKTVVQVTIADVNDNRPIFSQYPFITSVSAHAAPGTQLIQLEADDDDEGPNGEVLYSFTSPYLNDRFHLDAETGVVTVAGSLLADAGYVFHCEVEARDKGHPPRAARGVVEIHVGEDFAFNSRLHFQNDTYIIDVFENTPPGKEIIQVKAIPPSGVPTVITYSIKSGNEESAVDIDPRTGIVTIRNSHYLDYEVTRQIRMLVVAHSDGRLPLHGYATLIVRLVDQNDNSPSFSQEHYVSSVWEGNNKGTFVTQVTASDDDQNGNGIIVYHIIEGNHDNAFIIDPPFSGIVKTNIVLDREIRDTYHLTIIATDDGTPQLTGTCTLRISIIDVNDNQPVFPPHSVVSISEGAEVGTVITTITANDVDTNPALIYSFADGGNPNNLFSIDRFSGRITLAQPLDHEKRNQYLIQIYASDSSHLAETSLTVRVTDVNDNPPIFNQQPYQVTVPELVDPGYRVITVNATDLDSGMNAQLHYSMSTSAMDGFYIDENTGTIYTNKSLAFDPRQHTIQLIVTAVDKGQPPMTAVAAVHIQVVDVNNNAPKFSSPSYKSNVLEDAPRGFTIMKVSATDHDKSYSNHNIDYRITEGNVGEVFAIAGTTGEIILMKSLDREEKETYILKVIATDRGSPSLNSSTEVHVFVEDVNDNPPVFNQTHYLAFVSEMIAIDTKVLQVVAKDIDEGVHSKVIYDITSGNDDKKFSLNANTGIITIRERLDYDTVSEYKFIVRATDSDPNRPLSALASVVIKVQDENDNAPHFPLTMYREAIEENSPVGTPVFMAHAIDADRGFYGKLNYSVTEGEGKEKFRVDPETGLISSLVIFDYESKNRYFFTLMAMDSGGKYATVQVQVDIESKDEYPPEFSQNSYHYTIPGDASIGYLVGNVHASDLDEGIDGRVVYQLRNSQSNFAINSTTGAITVKSMFHREVSSRLKRELRNQELSLYVLASSGRPNSLSSSVVVDVLVDFSLNSSRLSATEQKLSSSLPAWGMGLVIALSLLALVLLGMIFFLRKRTKRSSKPAVVQGFDNSFDTIDIHHPPSSSASISQFPPHYSDISHFDPPESSQHVTGATSEVSDQSHSASSGRGSAEEGEDVEDEEIRMINEGPLLQQQKLQRLGLPDSGLHRDDDNMSDISVHNTQEYLARLGINTSHSDQRSIQDYSKISNSRSVESMYMFDEEGGGEGDGVDIGNLIYSKLHEVGTEENEAIMDGIRGFGFGDEGEPSMTGSLSSIVHSEEELTGSYNWDYLLDWGPQYQPLAHVFAEIARLKDDSVPSSYASSAPKTLNPQVKTVPPPLITNVAPRSIAPVALSSGHTSQVASFPTLPRSPIGYDSTFSSPAMSPSFSPALSPLATRSPSISPLVSPNGSSSNSIQLLGPNAPHLTRPQRSGHGNVASSGSETELQI